MALSKLSERCKKCPHVENCDDKRMEACGALDVQASISVPLTLPTIAPVIRDDSAHARFQEEVRKQLEKEITMELYRSSGCRFGA